ncbi:MAG: hypothetical protein JNM56_16615 [Planctomycetia bacterium]|nr:hypothetical protein [Planctomycetia bacterium]
MSSLANKLTKRWLALLMAAALAAAPAAARADNIDKELVKKGPELVQELKKKGYHNIGVLKFTVKKGKSELSFNAGTLNHNMATRLENALILANDAENPMGIIRDATSVAAAQAPKATYLTPEGREQLFKLSYPLAWGNQKVTADVFISGVVDLSSDMKETALKLVYFDKKSGKLQDLMSFAGIKTDRGILADSGQSFALAKRGLMRRDLGDSAADALNAWAEQSAQSNDSSSGTGTQSAGDPNNPRDSLDLLRFEVLVNGTAQPITKDSASPGEYRMDKLTEGQTVVFQLTNLTNEKIGVVVKVNGQSTINKEEAAEEQCTRWMLEPNAKNILRGFYLDKTGGGTEVELFRVTSDDEAKSAWSGFKRPGYIDLAVFRSSEIKPTPSSELGFSARGMSKRSLSKSPPATAQAAKEMVRKGMGMAARGILTGGNKEDVTLDTSAFVNPQFAANAHIMYYANPAP